MLKVKWTAEFAEFCEDFRMMSRWNPHSIASLLYVYFTYGISVRDTFDEIRQNMQDGRYLDTMQRIARAFGSP